jgi:putative flippase GtrA
MNLLQREFIRYSAVGALAFCADFALLAALSQSGMHYLLAVLLAFLVGTWVNYRLSVRWVFAYRALSLHRAEFGVFLLVGLVTLAVSLALIGGLVEQLGLHLLWAKCLVAGFTLVLNFAGRRALLFTRWKRRAPIEPEKTSL